jgi:WD40 repeat protein
MAESNTPTVRDASRREPFSAQPSTSTRPCPLCRETIEIRELPEPQSVVCGSCGLRATIEASPPPAAPSAPTVIEIVEVPPAVTHWLEREPRPLQPSGEPTPEELLARRRRRLLATAAIAATIALATLTGIVGHQRASRQFARQQAAERTHAQQNEARLLALKDRQERDRQEAEAARAAAEREMRLVTAKYLAAQAGDMAKTHCWRAVATAIESVRITLVQDNVLLPEAHQSLRDALAECPPAYPLDGLTLGGHAGGVTALAASPDGRWLATGSADRKARLWDLRSEQPERSAFVLKEHAAPVSHVLFSNDGRWLITGGRDSIACIWNLAAVSSTPSPVVLPGRDGRISNMAISANSRWLAIVFASVHGKSDTAMLWDLGAGAERATSLELNGAGGRIQAVAISPNSRWLALGVEGAIHLWDLDASVPAIASISRRCQQGVAAALFSNDGKWLVTSPLENAAGNEAAAQLWDLSASDPSTSIVLRGHAAPVKALTISGDSRWLVTAANDKTVRVWDLHAGDPSAAPRIVHTGKNLLTAAAITADGRWLAASESSGDVHLWDLAAGPDASAVVLRGDAINLTRLTFTSDLNWLAAAGDDRSVRVWNVDIHDLMNRATAVAMARKESVAARYAWLHPSQTIAGELLLEQVTASKGAVVWGTARNASAELQANSASIVAIAETVWSEFRDRMQSTSQLAKSAPTIEIAQVTDGAVPDLADEPLVHAESSEITPTPADLTIKRIVAPAGGSTPRTALQTNTLRIFVR